MGQKEGMFYGESRVYTFPELDLNGIQPNQLTIPTDQQVPLQLDKSGDWGIYGLSAVKPTPAAGGLASNTLINFQVEDQDTSERFFRQSNQAQISAAPLEHVAGKAGFPAYPSWPRVVKGGARLYPYVEHLAAAAPTGASPYRIVAHAVLLKPGQLGAGKMPAVPIGSRAEQLKRWGGFYVEYTGVFPFSAADPLVPQATRQFQIPITGSKFFFVDSLWCRQANANIGPNDAENPLTTEDSILVSVKDTSALTNWNSPGFAPLWSMFGSRAAFPYVPPTAFIVRPLGNIEVTIKNDGVTNIEDRFEFTFGGILVNLPKDITNDMLAGS